MLARLSPLPSLVANRSGHLLDYLTGLVLKASLRARSLLLVPLFFNLAVCTRSRNYLGIELTHPTVAMVQINVTFDN